MRRILFPYSGEEPLSLKQSLRVMLAWMLLFPLSMSLITVVIAVLEAYTLQGIAKAFAFSFLSGVCIFGMLGWLVVIVNNKSARIHRAWKTRKDQQ
jgi:hypothetical protein